MTRYELVTIQEDNNSKPWFTKIGVAFPTKSGDGFNLLFSALPIPDKEGKVRVLMKPPMERDDTRTFGRQSALARPQSSYSNELDDEVPF